MYSETLNKIIDSFSSGLKISGKLMNQITTEEKQSLYDKYKIEDLRTIIYCVSLNINIPNCLFCGKLISLKGTSRTFKKFCDVKCSCKYNNNKNNIIKNKIKSDILNDQYVLIIDEATKFYIDNIYTIEEVADKYNIPYSRLRKHLNINGLVKSIIPDRHLKTWKQKHNFLFDGSLEKLIDEGHTSKSISNIYDISPNCVAVYAKKNGCIWKQKSIYEKYISDFFEELGVIPIKNSRKIISPLELDFYIPEHNIAIELNGNYWHSDKFKEKDYHLHKHIECKNKNIRLLQFFEHELSDNMNQVKDIIKSSLNLTSNIIYARKTLLRQIERLEAKSFLDNNHLFGYINSSLNYGLYHNNELVSVATFAKPRFNKEYELELIRFANKIDHRVIGGLSKLLKKVNIYSIISYAHRRLFSGDVYEKCGFTKIRTTNIGYFWSSLSNGQILSRYQTQKHKLNTTMSENDYMRSKNYVKIFDCGQNVYGIKVV